MIALNGSQTLANLPLDQAIEAIEKAMILYDSKKTITPQRHILATAYGPTIFMPSILNHDRSSHEEPTEQSIGIKVVSVRPENKVASVPAVIMLMNTETGLPKLLFNATDSTAIRTACCSAVASKYLARKESSVLTVLGCGQQGKYHVLTCCLTCENIDTVILWNRSESRAVQLLNELVGNSFGQSFLQLPFQFASEESHGGATTSNNKRVIRVRVMSEANEAVRTADILCTCTNTNKPLFDGKNVKSGAHINCIGSYKHDMQEVDSDLVARSRMVADDSESVWKEAGDVNIPLDQGLITRQHILLDNMGQLNEQSAKSIVRINYDSDITMFKCVGMAAQDIAIADVVWRNIQLSDRSQMQTVDIQ